jgi:hypothetical protein
MNKTAQENRTMVIKLARPDIQKAVAINITAFRVITSCRRLVVYCTSLSVSRLHTQSHVVGWMVNDEPNRRMIPEFAWMNWSHENLSQDKQWLARDWKRAPIDTAHWRRAVWYIVRPDYKASHLGNKIDSPNDAEDYEMNYASLCEREMMMDICIKRQTLLPSCFVKFQLFRLPLISVSAFVQFLKSATRSHFVETESIHSPILSPRNVDRT